MTEKRGISFGKSPHFQTCSRTGNIAQQLSTCLAIVTCHVQFQAPQNPTITTTGTHTESQFCYIYVERA